VQVYFPAYPATLAALPTGKIKLLGVFLDQRTKQRPDLPTVKRGAAEPHTVPSWFGFMGPAGLPAPIVARLETEIRKALEDPEISKKLEEVGIIPIGSTGADMAHAAPQPDRRTRSASPSRSASSRSSARSHSERPTCPVLPCHSLAAFDVGFAHERT
jgi:tripartite-type tricarboxylate transporter receptor subunit TctC